MFVDAILDSEAKRRVVVAGPGTGKSYLFQSEVGRHEGKPLLISFLRALIEEMEEKLGAVAHVRTFHSFCKLEFLKLHAGKHPEFKFHYPALTRLIDDDLIVAGTATPAQHVGRAVELAMQARQGQEQLEQWLQLAERYHAYGHTDLVYRVLKCIEEGDEVPHYEVVIVDEFQDFSPLERGFIEHLTTKGRSLIVGDDDQALYEFKKAGPDGIRDLFSDAGCTIFSLPYCSRCTPVVVDATHALVGQAQKLGLLKGRIEKPFVCYLPDKQGDGEKYPKIIHAVCSGQSRRVPYMARYIKEQIEAIPDDEIAHSWEGAYPTALVIGPNPFRKQVYDYLKEALPNVTLKASEEPTVERIDAVKILVGDEEANLGWRIACYCWPGMNPAVKKFLSDAKLELRPLLPAEFVSLVLSLVGILRAYKEGLGVSSEELQLFEREIGLTLQDAAPDVEQSAAPEEEVVELVEDDRSKPSILCTSFPGSKGLSAAHVFIVGMNEGHVPRHDPTDVEVMNLLVGLTRTRKSCHVLSVRQFNGTWLDKSRFVDWIGDQVEELKVDRAYFG